MTELEILRDKLRALTNDITAGIAVGSCKTYDEYRYQAGQINGLKLAERELLELKEQLEQE